MWYATKRSIDSLFPPAMFSDLTRLPPSVFGCPTTGYRLTVLPIAPPDCCLNNDKTRTFDRAVITRLSPDHLPVSYYLTDATLSASLSAACMLAWQLQHLSLSAAPPSVARAVCISRRPPVARSPVPGRSQIPTEMHLLLIVRCSHGLASMSAAAT